MSCSLNFREIFCFENLAHELDLVVLETDVLGSLSGKEDAELCPALLGAYLDDLGSQRRTSFDLEEGLDPDLFQNAVLLLGSEPHHLGWQTSDADDEMISLWLEELLCFG